MPQHKATPANMPTTKSIEDRTVIGIAAVHGVVDDGMDRSHMGAFSDTKINGRDRAVFLWQHTSDPPTAVINYVREVPRDQLPEKITGFAPEATGGVEISRTYLDTPRGNEILAGLKAGAINEMSYAYDVVQHATTEDERGPIRELYLLKTYDFSDVLHGMNANTLAVKRMPLADHSESVLAAVKEYTDRLLDLQSLRAKEGRVLSGENRKRIESAMEALAGASDALKTLLEATEPQKGHAETNAIRIRWIEQQQRLRELGVYP